LQRIQNERPADYAEVATKFARPEPTGEHDDMRIAPTGSFLCGKCPTNSGNLV
jgi:hypothetical protein